MLVKDLDMVYKHYIGVNHFIIRRMIGTTVLLYLNKDT